MTMAATLKPNFRKSVGQVHRSFLPRMVLGSCGGYAEKHDAQHVLLCFLLPTCACKQGYMAEGLDAVHAAMWEYFGGLGLTGLWAKSFWMCHSNRYASHGTGSWRRTTSPRGPMVSALPAHCTFMNSMLKPHFRKTGSCSRRRLGCLVRLVKRLSCTVELSWKHWAGRIRRRERIIGRSWSCQGHPSSSLT